MRVLITMYPGHGHLAPLAPLAIAIQANGHDVVVATSETFREAVEALGLRHESCGPVWRESDFGQPRGEPYLLADMGQFIQTTVNAKVIADLRSIVARSRPDILLSNDYEPCGRVVAEERGIPFVLASSGPRVSRAVQDRFQGFVLRKAREAAGAGVSEGHELDYSLKWLRIHFCPPSYAWCPAGEPEPAEAPNQFGIRPQTVEIGAAFQPPATQPPVTTTSPPHQSLVQPPPHMPVDDSPPTAGDSRPTALCTFGTVFNKDPQVLRLVVEAVAPLVKRLLVLPGPGVDVTSFGALPGGPGVDVTSFDALPRSVEFLNEVSLSTVLPHVDYVVSHGGTATLLATQLAGKPCLLLPRGADQILNGAACHRTQLAVVRFHTMAARAIGIQPLPPMTVESVASAFSELVANASYRERALRFRSDLEALPPMSVAVNLIEELAATGAPITRR